MILVKPEMIREIDSFAERALGCDVRELMRRAGEALSGVIRKNVKAGGEIVIFAGSGNNGGDGYAAAVSLINEYKVKVYDVFGEGQRSEAGRYFLELYLSLGGEVCSLDTTLINTDILSSCELAVDAVFGTGFRGELPNIARDIIELFNRSENVKIVALDVPLGIDARDGRVDEMSKYRPFITLEVGFVKRGLLSYPAKEYVGKLEYDNIGLHNHEILDNFHFSDFYIDYDLASSYIPKREENSNKGSFGRALLVSGSERFPGAAHLTLEAALRSGAGLVCYLGEDQLSSQLIPKFPEAIYKPLSLSSLDDEKLAELVELSSSYNALLVGSGASRSVGLLRLVRALLSSEGPPVVLDADAINVLSELGEEGIDLLASSRRATVLTPHPLELSRLVGIPTEVIQSDRLRIAEDFARRTGVILVLKGAGTVITDGRTTYINSSGSSALAKGGSGDVLAGFLTGVIASGQPPLTAAAFSVYFHGLAADVLEKELSPLGVIPSDLPREICRQIALAIKNKPSE